jgi:hypothetical protein
MGNNPIIFRMKALAVRALLDNNVDGKFSFSGCPSRRELEIQVAKLERMLGVFVKKFEPQAAALKTSAERKAFRRKIGPEIAKLDRQAKKMQVLFLQMLEESVFIMGMPRPEGLSRRQFRRALTASSDVFEKVIYDGMQQFQKELSGASGRKHLKS